MTAGMVEEDNSKIFLHGATALRLKEKSDALSAHSGKNKVKK